MIHKIAKRIKYIKFLTLLIVILITSRTLNPHDLKLEPITEIFSLLGLKNAYSLEDLNNLGQKYLLRQAGTERWQIKQQAQNLDDALKDKFNALNFIKEINPPSPFRDYNYIIITGATHKTTQKRINYTANYIQQENEHNKATSNTKQNCPKLAILTGSRPLNPLKEDLSLGATEAAMIETLIKDSPLKDYPYVIVDAPMKKDNKGGLIRPNTDDTIYEWLKYNPTPGKCLIISSQPYIQRQEKVFQTLLPQTFKIEAAGPETKNISSAIFLDELARTLYQEVKLKQSSLN